MARDYRPRQPKMLDTHSARHKRQEKQSGNRNLWLSMFLMMVVMLGGIWVVSHFASSGVKSSAKAAQAHTENLSEAASQTSLDDSLVEADVIQPKVEKSPSNNSLDEPLQWLREPSSSVTEKTVKVEEVVEPSGIFVEALPMPEAAKLYAEPEITFYDTINDIEVIPDDTTPISVALETPKYLLAGSFFSPAAAQRALKRLSEKGQKLYMCETWSNARKRAVYVLYTAPYHNRLKLNARKNELRALGAGVMERDYRIAETSDKQSN
ncbi:SPOR domain-containing protein [uncultured Thiomicrorhabdus sp.]